MKKIVHLVLSLTVISAVCAAVLATVNAVTQEQIKTIKRQAKLNAARLVLPKATKKVVELDAAAGLFVGQAADGRELAYAVTGKSTKGYGGDIVLMVGFMKDYTITSYRKLEAAETPGLGSNLTAPGFMKQFKGLSAAQDLAVKKDGGTVVAITSATITSRAVCDAVNNARATLQKKLAQK